MSDLTKYGTYIETAGTHHCTIISANQDIDKKGEECIIVTFQDNGSGQTIRNIYHDNPVRGIHLKRLAEAARLTTEQMQAFDPDMLVGKMVSITTTINGKYCNVNEAFHYAADLDKSPAPAPAPAANEDVPF